VFVVGGGNSAGQAALHLGRYAGQVTLLVRGPSLSGSMSDYLTSAIDAAPNIDVSFRTEVVDGGGDGRLEEITLREPGGGPGTAVEADGLFVMIGAKPGTEWLPPQIERDQWGYILTGPEVERDPDEMPTRMGETSVRRIFAVGDVRHGSVKRVASAVGEGSIVIQQVHRCLVEEPTETIRVP
jgi:thioredoxin reductase (NADPH)